MANLKPLGINLETGQINAVVGGDILRPDQGNLTISSGPTQTNGTSLSLQAGHGNGVTDSSGGTLSLTSGDGSENGDGGFITMTAGGSGTTSGDGGSFYLEAGDANTSGNGGGFQLVAGSANGAGVVGGSFTVFPGDGYNHGNITMQVQGYSTTAAGGVVQIRGGSDGDINNYAVQIETYGQTYVGVGSSSILIQTGSGDGVAGTIHVDTGTSGGGETSAINLGTENAWVVTIGAESNPQQTVNIYNSNLRTTNMGSDGSPLIALQYGHFAVDANGYGVQVGPIYYDPNTGETIKIGTQINACIYLEGDAANNTVRGGDGGETHVIALATQPTSGGPATYNLASNSIDPLSPLAPGTVTIRSILDEENDYSEVTDDGAGAFGLSTLLPAGGTVDYTTGNLTGTTATLRIGVQINAIYTRANANGEPLTPKGGNGVGTGDGGELRLYGGDGGATGDGGEVVVASGAGGATSGNSGNISINTGSVTSGTVGEINIGTGETDYWTFTSAGNLVKQVQGNYLLSERLVEAFTQTNSPLSLSHNSCRRLITNEGASGELVIQLPTAAARLEYLFFVSAAQNLKIQAASGDTIQVLTLTSPAAGYIEAAVSGSSITLVAINATEWVATSALGTWTVSS